MAFKNYKKLRSGIFTSFLMYSLLFPTFSYASDTDNESTTLIQRSINFLKEMSTNAYKKAFKDKENADPNDPRNDPRLKYHFGSAAETAPVEAVVKTGGVTMTFKANEMIGGSLRPHPVLKDSVGDHFSFALTYPDFKERNEENFEEFYRKVRGEQENIWLRIGYHNKCGIRGGYGFGGALYKDDLPITFPLSEKDKVKLVKNKNCTVFWNNFYDSYGEPQDKNNSIYDWKSADALPALSKHFALENIELRGFKGYHHFGDVNNIFTIEQRVYRYIPNKKHPEEFEFMTCAMSNRHKVKLDGIIFKKQVNYSCEYHFPFLKRAEVTIRFNEEHVNEWLKTRNGVYKFFKDKVISVDDYVPSHYSYDENNNPIPIPLSLIEELIKERDISRGEQK